jgi:hypothetical protein
MVFGMTSWFWKTDRSGNRADRMLDLRSILMPRSYRKTPTIQHWGDGSSEGSRRWTATPPAPSHGHGPNAALVVVAGRNGTAHASDKNYVCRWWISRSATRRPAYIHRPPSFLNLVRKLSQHDHDNVTTRLTGQAGLAGVGPARGLDRWCAEETARVLREGPWQCEVAYQTGAHL